MAKEKMVHYNPNTGKVEKCGAKQGKCPFGSKNHFPEGNIKEAQAYADRKNELKVKAEDVMKGSDTEADMRNAENSILLAGLLVSSKGGSLEYSNALDSLKDADDLVLSANKNFSKVKFQNKEIEDEAKEELSKESIAKRKEIKNLIKESKNGLSLELEKETNKAKELIKSNNRLSDEEYFYKSKEIKAEAGRMLRNSKLSNNAYNMFDNEKDKEYFKNIENESINNYKALTNTLNYFEYLEHDFNDEEEFKSHLWRELNKQEFKEDIESKLSEKEKSNLEIKDAESFKSSIDNIIKEDYPHLPEIEKEELRNRITEETITKNIMNRFSNHGLKKEIDFIVANSILNGEDYNVARIREKYKVVSIKYRDEAGAKDIAQSISDRIKLHKVLYRKD